MTKPAQFFRVFRGETLASFLNSLLDPLGHPSHEELIELGAVYVDQKRVRSNIYLRQNQIVRIHTHPRRYLNINVDWRERVIFENDDFIVIDKPHGLPVHATLDNALENLIFKLEKTFEKRFYVTQRLDIPTGGLIVLAKTPAFQSQFNRMLALRKVKKTYKAVLEQPLEIGFHTHYMQKSKYQPKLISTIPSVDHLNCELTVHRCDPIHPQFFLTTIELHTGRTHQIRAQTQYLGAPLVGDSLYGSRFSFESPYLPLLSYELAFLDGFHFQLPEHRLKDALKMVTSLQIQSTIQR